MCNTLSTVPGTQLALNKYKPLSLPLLSSYMYEPFQHRYPPLFPCKVPPPRILTPWSQRSRWTTPWRWLEWLLVFSCSSSFSWAWCSPSKGGESGLLSCRLWRLQVATTLPHGQVIALLITFQQGPMAMVAEVLKPQLWFILLVTEGMCFLRCVWPWDGQFLMG